MKKDLIPMNLQLFAAETGLTVTNDFAKAISIDFTNRFEGSLKKLIEALGITRTIPMSQGMLIKTYKSEKDIKNGTVSEGDVIPLSKVKKIPGPSHEIKFSKYRKSVSAEAIQTHGFASAVLEADDLMLKELQRDIRSSFFTFLGTGTGIADGIGLQGALAQAWGYVQTKFEDDGVNTICFVNPLDVADYIGKAGITTQTVFGLTFVTGFTGVTVITNTNVPKGKVYATAPENVVLAYVTISGGELGKAFSFTTDETGYIGVTHQTVNDSLTYETVCLTGVKLFAERIDGVVVVDIKDAVETPPVTGA